MITNFIFLFYSLWREKNKRKLLKFNAKEIKSLLAPISAIKKVEISVKLFILIGKAHVKSFLTLKIPIKIDLVLVLG